MAFDGAALHCIVRELQEKLTGSRIEKIYQPEKDELHFILRNYGTKYRLVISASSNHPRLHLSDYTKENPSQAPMLCMLLRKKLIGGRLADIAQYDLERIVRLRIDARDELGREATYTIHHEIMGRHSNIILTDAEGRIIDSVKRIDEDKSRIRQILPGLRYEYPPSQGKLNPLMMNKNAFHELLLRESNPSTAKLLSTNLMGLSPVTARYIGHDIKDMDVRATDMSGDDIVKLSEHLETFYQGIDKPDIGCYMINDPVNGELLDFAMLPFAPMASEWLTSYDSPNALVDAYYHEKDTITRLTQRTSALTQSVKTHIKRAKRKLKKQLDTLDNSKESDTYRLYGELLTSYQSQVPKGANEVDLINYYSENGDTITIPLDPEKSANVNAQKYYKKYQKAQTAMKLADKQSQETMQEIDYLESTLQSIESCGELSAADEIKDELIKEGYIKKVKAKKTSGKTPESKPYHFVSKDGYDIYVGRNNRQNDLLTMKMARGDDLWLHTQSIPGSHVIIKAVDGKISEEALHDGAVLAAWFSKGRSSSNVPVDYTLRRNIRKPNGAKPGYVIFSSHSTINVTASPARFKQIQPAT